MSSGFVTGPIPGSGDGAEDTDLTYDEERSVTDYVSSASYKLNVALRNGLPLSEQQQTMVNNLDKALKKLPLYTDKEPLNRSLLFMYPGESEEFVKDALEKGYIQEESYASSTQHGVYNDQDDVRIVIKKSHSGRQLAGYGLEVENEVLFKRNTKFIVTNSYVKDGKQFIEVVEDGDQEK